MSWLKDPLTGFLIIGAVIFILAGIVSDDEISYDVEVRDADIKRLHDHWSMQMRRPPTAQELTNLVDQFVKDEIYYREAQRLGLHANDSIVRRRMVQKLTFLTEDIAISTPIEETALRAYFEQHQDNYRVPASFSFSHRFFSPEKREDAEGEAKDALGTNDPGDPFMLQKQYRDRSEQQIGNHFGREFASALASLEAGDEYQGPIESAYGWHLVKLEKSSPAAVPDFADVAERVAADAQQAARQTANEAYYDELKASYNVSYPGLENTAE